MRIETPTGSGNFIDINYSAAGDLVVTIDSKDYMGYRSRASIVLHGLGKGEIENKQVKKLYAALAPFSSQAQ